MYVQQRILVIENAPTQNLQISNELRTNGYSVDTSFTGTEGVAYFEQHHHHLVIVSKQLPDADSVDICRRIRQCSHALIILLSYQTLTKTEENTAYEAGVNELVLFPFENNTFAKHIRELLKQYQNRHQEPSVRTNVIAAGDLQIDLDAHLVTKNGRTVRLSQTEWTLLTLLVRNMGHVLTYHVLTQRLWVHDDNGDNVNLRVVMGRLRKKLETDPANPQYLLTEAGIGYRFALDNFALDKATNSVSTLLDNTVNTQTATNLTNLPHQRTSFIGRETEIAHLVALLARPMVRLVTIIGPGGCGKTRLATELGVASQTYVKDGVVFIPLASINNPDLVYLQIAQVLGIRESAAQPLAETVKSFVRSKQLMLILDNMEQVIAAATTIAELLDSASGLKVVVTSRVRLNIVGEHEFHVPSLPLPDLNELPSLDALQQIPAVALFVERAQAVRTKFSLTAENASMIARICVQLDGLPLAIELAAARVRLLALSEILARLSSRLAFLVGFEQDRPERQQTIRSTLDWSYRLLSEWEQSIFAQLSVFVGGGTVEAAEAVCVCPNRHAQVNIDGILSLIDKSMLQRDEIVVSGHTITRFHMLEVIREYARERLAELTSESDADTTVQRHAHYYRDWAEQVEVHMIGAETEFWFGQLTLEHDNLQAAIQWAVEHQDYELALRLCAALWKFWHIRGYQSVAQRVIDGVLECSKHLEIPARVKTLYGAGWMHYDMGDWEKAIQFYEESLHLARKLHDTLGIAEALHGVGQMAQFYGDYRKAIACYEESLMLFRQLNNIEGIAWSLDHLGRFASYEGHTDRAIALRQEALSLFEQMGYQGGIAYTLGNLGAVLLQEGELKQAQFYLEEGIKLHTKLGNHFGAIAYLTPLAEVAIFQHDMERAESLLMMGLSHSQTLGYRWYSALMYSFLAYLDIERGEIDKALSQVDESLKLCRYTANNVEGFILALERYAELVSTMGAFEKAVQLYSMAVSLRNAYLFQVTPPKKWLEQRILGQAQTVLSPETFATAWNLGKAIPPEKIIEMFKHLDKESFHFSEDDTESTLTSNLSSEALKSRHNLNMVLRWLREQTSSFNDALKH